MLLMMMMMMMSLVYGFVCDLGLCISLWGFLYVRLQGFACDFEALYMTLRLCMCFWGFICDLRALFVT